MTDAEARAIIQQFIDENKLLEAPLRDQRDTLREFRAILAGLVAKVGQLEGRSVLDELSGGMTDPPCRDVFRTRAFENEFGVVSITEWSDGISLWVGGRMRWCSWRDPEFKDTRRKK